MAKTKSREQIFVKVYVTAEEKAGICASAASSGLSLSEYARSKIVRASRGAAPETTPQPVAAETGETAGGAGGKVDTRRRTRRARAYLPPGEYDQVAGAAARLRLSVSEFIRRLAMHTRLPNAADFVAQKAVRKLMKVNADLARIGNLLRNELDALGASRVSEAFVESVNDLHDQIRARQEQMKAVGVEISEAVRAGVHVRR